MVSLRTLERCAMDTTKNAFVDRHGTQHPYPVIGLLASPSRNEHGWPMLSTDAACVEAITQVGGEVRLLPIRSPHPGEDPFDMVGRAVLSCHGVLFPGSESDVAPGWYGQSPHPQTARAEPLLDWWTMVAAHVAKEGRLPLFGICGGMQRVNVAFGGTLNQHLENQVHVHRAHDILPDNWAMHSLSIAAGELAACARRPLRMTEDTSLLRYHVDAVCSMHHQSLCNIAENFIPWCWSSDGVIEGIGYHGPSLWFALAVLFHPEARPQAWLSQYLFHAYLDACRIYAARRRPVHTKVVEQLHANLLTQKFRHGPLAEIELVKMMR